VRTNVVIAGVFGLWLGTVVEVAGLFRATDVVTHNLYGWAGGILLVLGFVALSIGRVQKTKTGDPK